MSTRPLQFTDASGGLIEETAVRAMPRRFTPKALNVDIDQDGEIGFPRKGYRNDATVAPLVGTKIDGLWYMTRLDGTKAMVAAANDSIYRVKATSAVESLRVGLDTVRRPWSGAVWQGKLFLGNAQNQPLIYEYEIENLADEEDIELPTVWEDGNWPAGFALVAAGFNERLAAWGLPEDPSRVYFSALRDWGDWTSVSAFSIPALEGDGEEVIAVVGYYNTVLVMKETRTAVFQNLDPVTVAAGTVNMTILPYGCKSQKSIIVRENGVFWYSQHGPVNFSTTTSYGDIIGKDMNGRISETLKRVSLVRGEDICGVHDRRYRRLSWWLPTRDGLDNPLRLDYYYDRSVKDHVGRTQGAWMLNKGQKASVALEIPSAGGELLMGGDFAGYVNQLNFMQRDLGEPIDSYYLWPEIDHAARARTVEADMMVADGGEHLKASLIVDSTEEHVVVDGLLPHWDGKKPPYLSRITPLGYGHTYQMKVEHNQVADDDAKLSGWTGHIGRKGRR